ncbi:unnamed protein product [Blepharisma stoltei]|uniref:Brl1/Brr6 domain-containing protein n=1 Tax=Blepharisma stoltei TaxID=1481888 RepID=A0AAU9ITF2_9CILI|nr:unnamed protein product [Blepharisma stoltei]
MRLSASRRHQLHYQRSQKLVKKLITEKLKRSINLSQCKTELIFSSENIPQVNYSNTINSKNSILILSALIVIIVFLSLLKLWNDDVMSLRRQNELLLETEIDQCRRDYERNRCDTELRIPMAEEYCREKEKCLKLKANHKMLESNLYATLLGEVINSFIETLSWKSIFFFSFVLIGCILLWLYIPKHKKSTSTKD